jgi:predicted metal-dependent hydrolase
VLFRRSPPVIKAPRLQPGDVVDVGGWPVRLRVNPRARRISLRLDPARREVALTAPNLRRLPEAIGFAEARRGWIAARLSELPAARPLAPGATIEVLGRPCRLERAAMRIRPSFRPETAEEPARLLASGEGASFARAVERGLRALALAELTAATARYCLRLGEPAPPVALQDARSRWGSCRPAGAGRPAAIRYNWRLVLAPPAALDYVAAHECAHLVHPDHGAAFWALVRSLYGDPVPAQAWLRREGARLHAVGRQGADKPPQGEVQGSGTL